MKVDAANDLALLKAEGKFSALPVVASRAARLGNSVATVGFPNIGLQGFAPKFARGEIAALSGAQDDARFFQISVPVQPGRWSSSFSLFWPDTLKRELQLERQSRADQQRGVAGKCELRGDW